MTWQPELTPAEAMSRIAELNAYLDPHKAAAAERGESTWMGIPDRWYDALRWRCVSGHVTRGIIKSEERGGDVCPACGLPARLTFPEDTSAQAGVGSEGQGEGA
ncbi:cobalamin synthesis protein P47K [Deinococcus grandis]|uniref:Cobalamin synthesis protein P47K n=1 Tax=Deinococcus grandis TaxID=57498 RepID=A0A100HNH4_9DEIO|nr:hypothetical protein [Deinococcus grandis]GAQ23948.1 cobalamin synthesis protein P47K [Deinococcus grandis]